MSPTAAVYSVYLTVAVIFGAMYYPLFKQTNVEEHIYEGQRSVSSGDEKCLKKVGVEARTLQSAADILGRKVRTTFVGLDQ
jgi:hypothetical protein